MRRNSLVILSTVFIFVGLGLVISYLAPTERTLGSAIRLIYIHAGLYFAALTVYTLGGFFALLLLSSPERFNNLSRATIQTAFSLWLIYVVFSMVIMKLIWGMVAWMEPKFVNAVLILALTAIVYLVSTLISNPKVISILYGGLAILFWILTLGAKRVLHPGNAIVSSPSLSIKIFTLIIILFFLAGAIQLIRFFLFKLQLSESEAQK